jgi:hypothetical protein
VEVFLVEEVQAVEAIVVLAVLVAEVLAEAVLVAIGK